MTARTRVLSAALLRAGLLAAVLAIVAGIFGMHVMAAHSSHAGHPAVAHSHTGDTAGHPAGHAAVANFSAAESCSSGCPGAQEAGAPCIPLAKTASLAVVPPQAGTAGPAPTATARGVVGYSYIPSSPTPCDLSISRT